MSSCSRKLPGNLDPLVKIETHLSALTRDFARKMKPAAELTLQPFVMLNNLRVSVEHHLPGHDCLRRTVSQVLGEENFMEDPRRLLATVVISTVIMTSNRSPAQTFVPTAAPDQNWVSITCSTDGQNVAGAGAYGFIMLSADAGANWAPAQTLPSGPEPQRPWQALAGSADGSKLVAVATFNPIFVSTNHGQSWLSSGPAVDWAAAVSSADGTRLFAADNDMGAIYSSTNSGLSWVKTSAPAKRWRALSCSADGTRLAAGCDFGDQYGELPAIYLSEDAGVSWTLSSAPALPYQAIASSSDGLRLAAAVYGGLIYLSHDAGAHWSPANVPPLHWGGISSSADGVTLVASAWEGAVYVSPDAGNTWTTGTAPEAPWQTVACSGDGNRLFAGIWNNWSGQLGGIYCARLSTGTSSYTAAASPLLSISFSAGGVVLSWPASATGFTVQESSDLTSPAWTDMALAPTTVDGNNQIVVPAASGNHFFRLVKP